MGQQTSGLQQILWDGRTAEGALLPPGIYLVAVEIRSDSGTERLIGQVAVAY